MNLLLKMEAELANGIKAAQAKLLKELMGYSQISMTMPYVHPTSEHKLQAAKKLAESNVEQVFALDENREGVLELPGPSADATIQTADERFSGFLQSHF